MALRADLLHVHLRLQVVGPVRADCVGQVPAEAVGRIVRHLEAVDAAHVACGAGGHKHVARGQGTRIGVEIQQITLRGKHDAMLRLVVDLHLRVVRSHVALAARGGQPGERNRAGVARMAFRAGADGAVFVGFADGVALLAAGGDGRMPFRQRERIGRTLCSPRLELLAEGNLLRLSPCSP